MGRLLEITRVPKPGLAFLHKRIIDPKTKKPMECVVTRVGNGVVYYKPVGWSRGAEYVDIDKFYDRVVKSIVSKEGLQQYSASGYFESTKPTIFTADTVDKENEKVKKSLKAPVVGAQVSTLGGAHRASIMIALSLDKKSEWNHGIFENSRYMRFMLGHDGRLEQFTIGWRGPKKFRTTRVKSVDDAINKINQYISTVKNIPYDLNYK